MSFQAYLDTIEQKSGKDAAALRAWGAAKGFSEDGGLKPGIKATAITDAAKAELGLGHGHAMAVYALLSGKKKQGDA